VPRRDDYHSRLSFQRATAMTDSTNPWRLPGDVRLRDRVRRRYHERPRIPYHPDKQPDKGEYAAPDLSQYREPTDLAKKYIASYARHVARDPRSRSPESPDTPVKSVKVYRVVHNMLHAIEMGANVSPEEPSKFEPYYVGEFDSDGNLLDGEDSGHLDPMLYWLVPIYRQAVQGEKKDVLKNYVTVHAGSAPPFLQDN
jgi:hypothetical protein